MSIFNSNLPLGLPDGSVRSILALVLTGVTSYLWVTAQAVPPELLTITSGTIAYYFASRGQGVTNVSAPDANVSLSKPYIPGDTEGAA